MVGIPKIKANIKKKLLKWETTFNQFSMFPFANHPQLLFTTLKLDFFIGFKSIIGLNV